MAKIGIGIGKKEERSCGTCTKCCEGWLSATINGQEMFPGKPCYLVEIGKGCSDYKNRPYDPCKTFKCMWKAETIVPEQFSPEATGIILTKQNINGIEYLTAVNAGKEMEPDFISWFVTFCVSRKINFEWKVDGVPFFIGSEEFAYHMQQRTNIQKPIDN